MLFREYCLYSRGGQTISAVWQLHSYIGSIGKVKIIKDLNVVC